MEPGDAVGNSQAEPRTGREHAPGLPSAEEAINGVYGFLGRKPNAGVANLNDGIIFDSGEHDVD